MRRHRAIRSGKGVDLVTQTEIVVLDYIVYVYDLDTGELVDVFIIKDDGD